MRTPDQDMAPVPAWQRQSGAGAGREFLVLFGNGEQEQDVINMHYLFIFSHLKNYTGLVEKLNREKRETNIDYSF